MTYPTRSREVGTDAGTIIIIIIIIIIVIITFIQYMKKAKTISHTKMDYLNLEKKYINKLIKVDKYM